MKTANYKWNDKVENFNYKLNKLREEINKYKKISAPGLLSNTKNVNTTKGKLDAKKREFPVIKNDEVLKNIYKRTNGGCALKDKNNNNSNESNTNGSRSRIKSGNNKCTNGVAENNNLSNNKKIVHINNHIKIIKENVNVHTILNQQKSQNNRSQNTKSVIDYNIVNRCITSRSTNDKNVRSRNVANKCLTERSTNHENITRVLQLPTSRVVTNKVVKTKTTSNNTISTNNVNTTAVISSSSVISNGNDKKILDKSKRNNEKKYYVATKHVKTDVLDSNKKKTSADHKNKMKFLHFEGEDGSIQVYPVYADAEVGFHNITSVEDDNLSQVKRENQDDDDIKTTKRLAEWSSELVYKHLEETIKKSVTVFKNNSIESRREELLKRMVE